MKKIWETGVILFAAWGFWGMIYPDLCFTEDVCQAVYEEDPVYIAGEMDGVEADDGKRVGLPEAFSGEEVPVDMFTRLCEAGPEQIRIKSQWFDWLIEESKGKRYVVRKE